MKSGMTAEEWYNKGVNLMRRHRVADPFDKAYKEAVDAFDKAIELNPQYAEAWFEKGNALTAIGRRKDAQDAYDEARKINPKKFPMTRKLNVQVATRVNSFFFCIMFAFAVLIWGWAMGISIGNIELQIAISCGGVAGIAIGVILTPLSFRKTSVSTVITYLRNFLQFAIVAGLIVWPIRTFAC